MLVLCSISVENVPVRYTIGTEGGDPCRMIGFGSAALHIAFQNSRIESCCISGSKYRYRSIFAMVAEYLLTRVLAAKSLTTTVL
jgi:hypothetical protein